MRARLFSLLLALVASRTSAQVLAGRTTFTRSTFTIDELTFNTLDATKTAGVLTGRLRTLQDNAMVAQTRYTHVYAKRDGRWQIVAAEATVAAQP
jgi:hypothetical protein